MLVFFWEIVIWYYQQFGLDNDYGFPAVTPGLHNLQSIPHCLPATRETKRMENKIIPSEQFSSRDISTCVGLLGLISGSLTLLFIILCLARRTKSVAVLESERRTEHSCKIFVLEPPPPYCSLVECQPPPSYHQVTSSKWTGRKMKQNEEDDTCSSQ